MNKKKLSLALLLCLQALPAFAFDKFVVKDIRIEGIERIEPGTIFSYLPVKVGEEFDDAKASKAIKALFNTGFFKDVQIEAVGNVLVVQVVERPAIASIDITGVKEFPMDELRNNLKLSGIAEGRIYDPGALEKAENEIKRGYFARGKYSVQITQTVSPQSRNRVAITLNVVEGDAAHINRIEFVGNHAFSDKVLRKQLALSLPGWFSRFTKDDQYSKQKLAADVETIKSYYLDRGYLDFKMDSNQVVVDRARDHVALVFNIEEGKRYKVSDIGLSGKLIVPAAELKKLILLKKGDIFSRAKLTDSIKAITDRLGDEGYALANVQAVPEADAAKGKVSFNLVVDPGKRVYIRRITFSGNSRTRDEVLRREMRVMEGGWYSTTKIRRSEERLKRLSYFNDVNVQTEPVPGHPDEVDVNFAVTERPTGSLMLGLGVASSEGLILSGSITQANVFGTGNYLSAAVASGNIDKTYSLSYTNPYVTDDGVSRGFDLYRRDLDASYLSVSPYKTSTYGAGVRYSVPRSEYNSINYGLAIENTEVDIFSNSAQNYKDFVSQNNSDPTATSAQTTAVRLDLGFTVDSRDSTTTPTSGSLNRIYGEVGTPLADLKYYKLNYQRTQFFPLNDTFTLMLNGQAGYAHGYGGKDLPFFKNFFVGGVDTVRGYQTASIGKIDPVSGYAQGGSKEFVGNAEVFFPFPGAKDQKTLRLSTFVDTGYVWQTDEKIRATDLRYSVGIGLTWVSPLGPMKFDLATPINAKPGDHPEHFQFLLGTTF